MAIRSSRVALALAGALILGLGTVSITPIVHAQDATPVMVAPPQDLLPPAEMEAEGQTAEINGVDIYYEVYGEGNGDPVILIHGGLSNGDHFVNQIPVLAENHEVVVMDSRGHGRSSFDDTPISYAVMAEDVLGLMDHLGIDKASIVGWSDGGIIGLDIAIHHPERLIKLIAYGANYIPAGVRTDVGDSERFNAYIEMAAGDYVRLSPTPDGFDAFLNNIGNMWATEPNYTPEQMGSITVPTLILDGLEEEAIYTEHALEMAHLIPTADLFLMSNIGHFAMFDKADEFNHIVLDYLGR